MHPAPLQTFVLSRTNYSDNDLIVSLFTLEQGRLKGFAPNARASRKRFGGSLEPPNRLDIQMTAKDSGLCRIHAVESARCFAGIRNQLESLALALYVCELVDQLTPEGHPLPRLFRLMTALLEHLEHTGYHAPDRRFFEINLLNILGYRPLLDSANLQSLRTCLRTGKFGVVVFSEQELAAAGRLLDQEIGMLVSRPLRSLTFLTDVT